MGPEQRTVGRKERQEPGRRRAVERRIALELGRKKVEEQLVHNSVAEERTLALERIVVAVVVARKLSVEEHKIVDDAVGSSRRVGVGRPK